MEHREAAANMNVTDCIVYTETIDSGETIFVATSALGLAALSKIGFGVLRSGLNNVMAIQADHLDMAFGLLDESDIRIMTLG